MAVRRIGLLLVVSVGVGLACVAAGKHGVFSRGDILFRDLHLKQQQRHSNSESSVFMILIDDESLRWMDKTNSERWPWSLATLGALVQACNVGNASAVLLDSFFLDPGQSELPEFASALRGRARTYVAAPFSPKGVPGTPSHNDDLPMLSRLSVKFESDGSVQVDDLCDRIDLPPAQMTGVLSGICDVTFHDTVESGTRARYRLVSRHKEFYFLTFALAALLTREDSQGVRIRGGIASVGSAQVALDRDGCFQFDYPTRLEAFNWVSAKSVIAGMQELQRSGEVSAFNPKIFNDKIVLIGCSAATLGDVKQTSVGAIPGVAIQAAAIEAVLHGYVAIRPSESVTMILMMVLCLTGVSIGLYMQRLIVRGLGVLLAIIIVVIPMVMESRENRWYPTSMMVGYAFCMGIGYVATRRAMRIAK